METKTRHLIMKLAEQYEKPEFVADDPVQFPRKPRHDGNRSFPTTV